MYSIVSKKKPIQLCDITPDSSQGVRQKAWRVRQHLPKDNLKQEAVISEILWIENAKVGARRQLYWNSKNTSLTQEMIQIASLRHKRNSVNWKQLWMESGRSTNL